MSATHENAPEGTGAQKADEANQDAGTGRLPRPACQCFTFTQLRVNESTTNAGDYIMQNAETKSISGETVSARFFPQYGQRPGEWLLDGVLPLVGVAMLEAETMLTGALVADDMGAMVATGQDWGGRATIIGRTILFNANGAGQFIEHDADDAILPLLDVTHEPHPEVVAAIKAAGGVDLLIIHVREQIADDALCAPKVALSVTELARDLECCVLLVTRPATIRPRGELHAAADVALYASTPRNDRPGDIVQTVGPGEGRGRWSYTLKSCIEFGDPETEIVGEVWEVAQNVQ